MKSPALRPGLDSVDCGAGLGVLDQIEDEAKRSRERGDKGEGGDQGGGEKAHVSISSR